MLLLIDNFDSFTYNLAQGLEVLGAEVATIRSGSKSKEELLSLNPTHIIIGPGPGGPKEARVSNEILSIPNIKIPILGVCLGHQCIAEVFGARVIRAMSGPVHGKTSKIFHNNQGVFEGLPMGFEATRYHSLAVDPKSLASCLEITATADDGEIMGIRHKSLPIEGVQFHPESVLTLFGMQLLKNFLTQTTQKESL